MLQTNVLVADKDANATGSSVEMSQTPFLPGTDVVGVLECHGYSGDVKIQGSDDNDSWSDMLTKASLSTSDACFRIQLKLKKYMRYVTANRTAGDVSVYLESAG